MKYKTANLPECKNSQIAVLHDSELLQKYNNLLKKYPVFRNRILNFVKKLCKI